MTEIVINRCHGGFGLSTTAEEQYAKAKGLTECPYRWDIPRDDPALVQLVKKLGDKVNTAFSDLAVVSIPDDVGTNWEIAEYDGLEHVAEKHRVWYG